MTETVVAAAEPRRARSRTRVLTSGLAFLVVVASAGCAGHESSRIGACPVQPGAVCSGNYMRGAKLAMASLFDADFDHADLTRVNLRDADLSGATLIGARLRHADLAGSDLSYADLTGSDLRRARLDGADLTGANMTNARITPDQLAHATLCRTIMADGSVAAPDC